MPMGQSAEISVLLLSCFSAEEVVYRYDAFAVQEDISEGHTINLPYRTPVEYLPEQSSRYVAQLP